MSTRSSHILTNDQNEHWYDDCSKPIGNTRYYELTLEFSKQNINIECNDDDYLIITINKECDLLKLLIECNLRQIADKKGM